MFSVSPGNKWGERVLLAVNSTLALCENSASKAFLSSFNYCSHKSWNNSFKMIPCRPCWKFTRNEGLKLAPAGGTLAAAIRGIAWTGQYIRWDRAQSGVPCSAGWGEMSKVNVQVGKLRLQPASLLQLLLPPCSKGQVDLCRARE